MKRNTTPTLCISINVDLSTVKTLDFVFKSQNNERSPALITKSYTPDTIKHSNGVIPGEVLFFVDFTPRETMLLPEGTIYMDTQIVTLDGKILETEITSFNMSKTLFSEVYEE